MNTFKKKTYDLRVLFSMEKQKEKKKQKKDRFLYLRIFKGCSPIIIRPYCSNAMSALKKNHIFFQNFYYL